MRLSVAPFLAVVGLLASVSTLTVEAKGKMSAVVTRARYVALGYDTLRGFISEREGMASSEVLSEERDLVEVIREQMEEWGHYVIVEDRKDAEILIGVRLARLVSVEGGGTTGLGGAGRARGGFASVEISLPYDHLTVFDRGEAVLWRVQRKGGLSGSPPMAFAEFRADVERAAKK